MSDTETLRPLLTITAEQAALDELIAANGGEMTDEVEAAFDALQYDFGAKVDAYMARRAALLRDKAICEAEVTAVMAEAARLAARVKRCDAAVKSLEVRLEIAMSQRKIKEYERGRWRIVVTPNTPSVAPVKEPPTMRADLAALPEPLRACVRVKPAQAESYEWDRNALLKLYKETPAALAGVANVNTSTRLSIS
jgi:hypothetical protein